MQWICVFTSIRISSPRHTTPTLFIKIKYQQKIWNINKNFKLNIFIITHTLTDTKLCQVQLATNELNIKLSRSPFTFTFVADTQYVCVCVARRIAFVSNENEWNFSSICWCVDVHRYLDICHMWFQPCYTYMIIIDCVYVSVDIDSSFFSFRLFCSHFTPSSVRYPTTLPAILNNNEKLTIHGVYRLYFICMTWKCSHLININLLLVFQYHLSAQLWMVCDSTEFFATNLCVKLSIHIKWNVNHNDGICNGNLIRFHSSTRARINMKFPEYCSLCVFVVQRKHTQYFISSMPKICTFAHNVL